MGIMMMGDMTYHPASLESAELLRRGVLTHGSWGTTAEVSSFVIVVESYKIKVY